MCLPLELERRARISIALRLRNPRLLEATRAELERLRPPPRSTAAQPFRARRCDADVRAALDLGSRGQDGPVSLSDAQGDTRIDDRRSWELFDAASFERRRGAYAGDPWDVFEPGGHGRYLEAVARRRRARAQGVARAP